MELSFDGWPETPVKSATAEIPVTDPKPEAKRAKKTPAGGPARP
jgi:hypothetical protein